MTNSSAFIYVFLALFVGVGLGFVIGRGRKTTGSDHAAVEQFQLQLDSVQSQLNESRMQLEQERNRNQETVRIAEQLKAMQDQVGAMQTQAKEANEQRIKAEATIAEQVSAMNSLNTDLVGQTRAISRALNNSKERGNFGEVQLENLLKNSGLKEGFDYASQKASSETTRPDIKLFLPDNVVLFIDSKVPFDSFLAAHDTEDENLQREYMKKHVADVRSHIKKLAEKDYQQTGDSPNYVVMFMPFDSLLVEALKTDSQLLGYANEMGVSLASPLTLWPILQNIKYVIGLQRYATEIHDFKKLAAKLLKNINNVQSAIEKVGSNIKTLVKTYNSLIPATETTLRNSAKRIAQFEIEGEKIAPLEQVVAEVRDFKPISAAGALAEDFEDFEDDVIDVEVVDSDE
jgi:DNA recombination protein RmuC